MELIVSFGLLLVGLVALGGGGELLVRGATTIARIGGVTPAVIGLTVVAMGTSLPELVVSVMSALRGTPDIAMGNVVGSNIFNVVVILGITAMVVPLPVHGTAVRLEWPFMFGVSLLLLLLARDGLIDRIEGAFLLLLLVGFTVYMIRLARREVAAEEAAEFAEEVEERAQDRAATRTLGISIGITVGGILLLVLGGRLLVDGAVGLARHAGLSERIIGLTIVAAGTSAPEVATSVAAALRRHTDVAVANMIGSNIFNVLAIVGVTSLVLPVPVSAQIVGTDMWWMIGTSALLFPIMLRRMRITRGEGALLLAVYGLYLWVIL